MKSLFRQLIFIFLIFLAISAIFALFFQPIEKEEQISLTKLVEEIEKEKIKTILISDNTLEIIYQDGTKARAKKEPEVALSETLLNYGLDREKLQKVEIMPKEQVDIFSWLGPILYFFPFLFLIFFFWLLFRQARTGASQVFDFTKAKARLFGMGGKTKEKVSFEDVGGLKEAKEELKEVVDFLKNPKKYLEIGARIPRGVLLMGSPGTGKTLLAKAIANTANVPFFSISASEVIELFVGVGASSSYDTNVLIRTKNFTKLLPIGEFVDQFYKENEEGLKNVGRFWTLGADSRGRKIFEGSNWKKVKAVYRHKVDKIYEIEFIGGKIKITGDHSLFVRERNYIVFKKASELEIGDILVALPYSVKGKYNPKLPFGKRTPHGVRIHKFPERLSSKEITVWSLENNKFRFFSIEAIPGSIAKILGLSEGKGVAINTLTPSKIKNLVYRIKITPALMKLLGYYTAEGLYHKQSNGLRFCFGTHEKKYSENCMNLMKEVFNLKPSGFFYNNLEDKSALVFYYNSIPIARWFAEHSGSGAPNKHVPEFIWDLPREYFLSYLDGLVKGDGYINKKKMIEFSSSSKQLVSELRWLLNMHGIPCSVTEYHQEGGRIIKNTKTPLPDSTYWRITVGKLANPFNPEFSPRFFKRPIIKKITAKPYDGYVYDLCGCENEAFFGGEKPILLHNSRVRSLFEQARKTGKAIIFIDEIDSIGKIRGVGVTGGHEEREQTLNQLLAEMDGIGREEGLIIMGATNKPESLDPALLRPGRFDRRIVLDLPDINDREEILKIHCRGKPLASDVGLREIAERTPGFSGADLANLVNEAAILAARKNKKQVYQAELLESIEKVLLGPERKSHILSQKEKVIAAFHEAGHALVSAFLAETEPVRKISIIARGLAAGYTLRMPTEERKIKTRSQFLAEMTTLLGGYTAEKLKFGQISTGAANDLEKASELARKLVKEFGMSSLGPISFGKKEELIFLGKEVSEQRNYSEKVASQIDREVAKFIKNAQKEAEEILIKKRKLLDKVAQTLIEKETIEKEEFENLIKKKGEEKTRKSKKGFRRTSLKVKIKKI